MPLRIPAVGRDPIQISLSGFANDVDYRGGLVDIVEFKVRTLTRLRRGESPVQRTLAGHKGHPT